MESVAWQSWTPALTTTSNPQPNIGSTGVATGLYRQVNRKVSAKGTITLGGTGIAVGTGGYVISLPVTSATTGWSLGDLIGVWGLFDSSSSNSFSGLMFWRNSTTVFAQYNKFVDIGAGIYTTRSVDWATTDTPVTLATGDVIKFSFTYEAAS